MLLSRLETDHRFREPRLALLIDPDKVDPEGLVDLVHSAETAAVDLILVGGSLLYRDALAATVRQLKASTAIPVVLFPGSAWQICAEADALLFLSLISGRNPDLLIGQQVQAAPLLRQTSLEVIPTGYLLVDGGRATTASYISNTTPLPADKPEIAAATALAGQYLGLKALYLDAGSGAVQPVPWDVIRAVREQIQVPLFVGGGIRTAEAATAAIRAGADVVVVGTAVEEDPTTLTHLAQAVHSAHHLAGL